MTAFCENGKLRVILTEAETVKYNIDVLLFENDFKLGDRALTDLLYVAALQSGFKTDSTKFIIEIYPDFSGGCEVFYIPEEKSQKCHVTAKAKAVQLYWTGLEFNNCNSMLSAIETLFLSEKSRYIKSCLYHYKGLYRLFLQSRNSILLKKLEHNFADGVISSAIQRAMTIEYGIEICAKNAVAVIGSALCHRPLS